MEVVDFGHLPIEDIQQETDSLMAWVEKSETPEENQTKLWALVITTIKFMQANQLSILTLEDCHLQLKEGRYDIRQ